MKLSHLIIATSLTAASFATFAAPQQASAREDKVVVSTQETAETTVPVTGVIVAPTTATLAPGATQQLTPTVAPANATNKSVTYSSSNEAVATVSVVGLITVKADATDGQTANITVTTADGAKTAVCVVTVETGEV